MFRQLNPGNFLAVVSFSGGNPDPPHYQLPRHGAFCVDMGEKEHHKACLANQALKEQTAKRLVGYFDFAGAVLDSYWIPLAGSDDLYLHFAADITQWAAKTSSRKTVKRAPTAPPATATDRESQETTNTVKGRA